MQYVLGNMLNGGGGLNADKLALDLQFAADKTLTARKGPTPTFSRGSTGTFVGSDGLIQSAAINTPRFDHDPVTLACRGLLIEEQRTNFITYSQDFSNIVYSKTGSSISSVSTTSPSGGTTSQKIVEDTSNGAHGIETPTFAAGTYTCSVFVKASGRSWFRFSLSGVNTWFNISSGVIGTIGAGHTASIVSFGNGWYRVIVTFTSASVAGALLRLATDNNISTYTGDGSSGLLLWGLQVEAGSFATSYIPTTTSALTRSADVCNITGAAFSGIWNPSEGTMFTHHQKTVGGANSFIFHINDNTFANDLSHRCGTTGTAAIMNVSNVAQLTGFDATYASGSIAKTATAIRLNDCAFSVNAGSAITDLSASLPTVNRMFIGSTHTSTNHLNGTISAIRYYKKRLPNAKLQALTV